MPLFKFYQNKMDNQNSFYLYITHISMFIMYRVKNNKQITKLFFILYNYKLFYIEFVNL